MNIVQVPSPNFSPRRDGTPQVLVLHIMAGSLEGCDSWFANPVSQASAHYGVSRFEPGLVHQYVPTAMAAWANGIVDGIDHGHASAFINGLPPGASPNRFSISIEHEGQGGDHLDADVFSTSVELAASLFGPGGALEGVPCDREHVLRHSEIGDHPSCPGFPEAEIESYIASVNARLHGTTPAQAPAWAVAAASTQTNQEAAVQTRPLDQAESIAALESAAHSLGSALNDNGVTVVEVTGGIPPEVAPFLPAGGRAFLFTTKAGA